jgi:hypothetical protein
MISLLRKKYVERNSVTENQVWCGQNEKWTKNLSSKKEATILLWIRATSRSEHGQYILYKGHSVEQGSRDSSVGIGIRLWATCPTNWAEAKIFLPSRRPHRLWGPHSFLSNGYRGLFHQGIKQPGRETDHSPSFSAEINNAWSYSSAVPWVSMDWCITEYSTFC